MKIISNKYRYEKVVDKCVEFEIDENNITYLTGLSGGGSYIAAIIPIYLENFDSVNHYGFTFFSAVKDREGSVTISNRTLQDYSALESALKAIPHYEDILNLFKAEGEHYNHRIMEKKDFHHQLNEWRVI